MSSMLEEAIVDAAALKEAAIKNAENVIVERYSDDIREAVETLLEGELEGDEPEEEQPQVQQDIPVAAMPETGEEEMVISMDDLKNIIDAVEEKEAETGEDLVGEPESHESIASELGAETAPPSLETPLPAAAPITMALEETLKEGDRRPEGCWDMTDDEIWNQFGAPGEIPIDKEERAVAMKHAYNRCQNETRFSESRELDLEEVVEIMEELVVDIDPQKSGWAGTPDSVMDFKAEMMLAKQASTESQEKLKVQRELVKRLTVENKKLREANDKYKALVVEADERIQQVNLANAKLLYTNRVMTNDSLNERQINKIVEAVQNADSIEEAKTIFETLQSAVGSARKDMPKSLSEAIERPVGALPRRRQSDNTLDSGVLNRMQLLAGIKHK